MTEDSVVDASPVTNDAAMDQLDQHTEKLTLHNDVQLSDSDDDLEIEPGNNYVDNLNLSKGIRGLMRFKRLEELNLDDADEDDDLLFMTPSVLKTPGALSSIVQPSPSSTTTSTEQSLFRDFGSKKAPEPDKADDSSTKTTKRKSKSKDKESTKETGSKKQKESKKKKTSSAKKRESKGKGKGKAKAKDQSGLHGSDDDAESDIGMTTVREKRPKAQRAMDDTSDSETAEDTNKPASIRSTSWLTNAFLSDTDSSSSDEASSTSKRANRPKKLSKKAILEMQRESDRMARAIETKLTPRKGAKSFAEVFQNHKKPKVTFAMENEDNSTNADDVENGTATNSATHDTSDESDCGLEIIGGPSPRRDIVLSPERHRLNIPWMSPPQQRGSSISSLNQRLQDRIRKEMLERRRLLQEEARGHIKYATPEEHAKKLLERERQAQMIQMDVEKHFMQKNRAQEEVSIPDDEDEDGDYVMDLSGEEDEEGELNENGEEDNGASANSDDESGSDEESPYNAARFSRKRKNRRKGPLLLDEEEDNNSKHTTQPTKKPEPAHSIANFFRKPAQPSADDVTDDIPENEEGATSRTFHRLVKPSVTMVSSDESEVGDGDEQPAQEDDQEQTEIISHNDDATNNKQADIPATSNHKSANNTVNRRFRSEYFDAEAEEEEDEFFGAGGIDIEDDEALDHYEQDGLLVDKTDERVDESELRAAFNKQMAESDHNMMERIVKDITSGGLRRRRAALEDGFILNDYDVFDDEDNDLVAFRRAAAAKRRKLLEQKGNIMEILAKDAKTAAFAKAAQTLPQEDEAILLSDDDGDDTVDQEEEKRKYETAGNFKHRNQFLMELEEEDEDESVISENDEGVQNDRSQKDTSQDSYFGDQAPLSEVEIRTSTTSAIMIDIDGDSTTVGKSVVLDVEQDDTWMINVADYGKKNTQDDTSMPPARPSKAFAAAGKLERFRSLISEAGSSLSGSNDTGPRIGFGSNQRQPSSDNSQERKTLEERSRPEDSKNRPRLLNVLSSRTSSFV
ncbi:MRC1-like domain-containing protein [Radiomyces spectabilis]|uniref:MRC1-like domain-containing protein n=1 Tax=Radiomyces spectabilis TaxID=64574 RepID=UPI00221F71A5|nr:MRC1-like domain-containing protein [Radiomyces spectabilis]KAI8370451.1 MRC1-like domain-containing protein [Radiomyces spectabilis]